MSLRLDIIRELSGVSKLCNYFRTKKKGTRLENKSVEKDAGGVNKDDKANIKESSVAGFVCRKKRNLQRYFRLKNVCYSYISGLADFFRLLEVKQRLRTTVSLHNIFQNT